MQKTRFSKFNESILLIVNPIFSESWTKRSVLLLSLLCGFYFTNSLISYLLDKSVNTIFLAFLVLICMEISIRSIHFSGKKSLLLLILSINNFRIGSTYALILEAFKLGS